MGNSLIQPECSAGCRWKKDVEGTLLSLEKLPVKPKANATLQDIISKYIFIL